MRKRILISESEKNNILQMYGLINEQSGGGLVPQSVYDAISKIESKYSYMENGKIMVKSYKGNEIESEFSKYIDETIGKEAWFKIDEKLRAQIYAYAFQSDSGRGGMFFRWIAGLANAIDNSIQRLDIVKKKLEDPNVQNAINIIKKACQNGSINSVYNNYLSILDQQYKSGDYNNNYKYIWKYRPIAIDRFMNGDNEKNIFSDWEKSTNQTQTTTQTKNNQQQSSQELNTNKFIITGSDLNDLRNKLKTQTKGISVDIDSAVLDVNNLKVTINKGQEKIQNFSLIFSDVSRDELNMVKQKVSESNPTVKYLGDVKELKIGNKTYYCLLIVIK